MIDNTLVCATLEDGSKVYTLHRNGIEAKCPHRTSLIVPGQNALGDFQAQLMLPSCDSRCPMFNVVQLAGNASGNICHINCAATEIRYDVTIVHEPLPEPAHTAPSPLILRRP